MSAIPRRWQTILPGHSPTAGGSEIEDDIPAHAIPTHWAVLLCKDICRETQHQWFSQAKTRCARCMQMYPTEVEKRGFSSQADNRGCPFINMRDAHYYWAFHSSN